MENTHPVPHSRRKPSSSGLRDPGNNGYVQCVMSDAFRTTFEIYGVYRIHFSVTQFVWFSTAFSSKLWLRLMEDAGCELGEM